LLADAGFTEDPFEYTNADQEARLETYFVPPPYFTSVRGDYKRPAPHIVLAPRGGGKSAQRRMIEEYAAAHPEFLCVTYDEYEIPSGMRLADADLGYHLTQVMRIILLGILLRLDDEPERIGRLSKDEKYLLKVQVERFLGDLSIAQFETALKSLRGIPDKVKAFMRKHAAGVALALDALKQKSGLSSLEVPDGAVAGGIDAGLKFHLEKATGIAKSLGFDSVYLLIDKVDENPLTQADAESTYEFIMPLLTDLGVLELPGLGIKFFLWDGVEESLGQGGIRRDRVKVSTLDWTVEMLGEMLAARLGAYSDQKIRSLNALACQDNQLDIDRLVVQMARSPRDVVRLGSAIIAQATKSNPDAQCLGQASVLDAVSSFSNERIGELVDPKHLGELRRVGSTSFTISRLANDVFRIESQAAGNKVKGWQRTGLVSKIAEEPVGRGRPQHVFGIVDPLLAVAAQPAKGVVGVLQRDLWVCPSCSATVVCDRDEATCEHCGTVFIAVDATSVLDACTRHDDDDSASES
jgi:hypothetical protein